MPQVKPYGGAVFAVQHLTFIGYGPVVLLGANPPDSVPGRTPRRGFEYVPPTALTCGYGAEPEF